MTIVSDPRIRIASAAEAVLITPLCAEHAAYERARFDASGHPERLARLMAGAMPRLVIFVADSDQHGLIGYASASREASTWRADEYLHMDCLFVREPFRGNRVGRLLFDAVADFARADGLSELQWQTPGWNEGAIRFYRSIGATPAAKMRFTLIG